MRKLAALVVLPTLFTVLCAPAFARHEGDYDKHHVWRDADWWHRYDPAWVDEHHPEWYEQHPKWKHHGHGHDHDGVDHGHDHDKD